MLLLKKIDSGYNIISYKWTFDDGNTSTLENPVQILTVPGEYKIKLVATSNIGKDI